MEKSTWKRAIIILTILSCIITSGCGGRAGSSAPISENRVPGVLVSDESNPTTPIFDSPSEDDVAIIFKKESLSLPSSGVTIRHSSLMGNKIFLCGDLDGEAYFFLLDLSSKEISELAFHCSEHISAFSVKQNGVICLLNMDEAGNYFISCLSPTGESDHIDLTSKVNPNGMVYSFEAFDSGFLIDNGTEVLAIDLDGRILKNYGAYPYAAQIIRLSNEKAIVVYSGRLYSSSTNEIARPTKVLFVEKDFCISREIELDGSYTYFFGGVEETLFTTIAKEIYQYNYQDSRIEKKLSINSYSGIIPDYYIGSDSFFSIEHGQPVIWTAKGNSETTILTLATYNADPLLIHAVQYFNDSNCRYTITINDYAKYDTHDNQTAGRDRYALDIITGNCPDIYDLKAFPADKYAAKGYLEDLLPYFEDDGDLSLNELYEPACNLYRGGLYELIPTFSIFTVCGSPDILPKEFTTKAFEQILEQHTVKELFGPMGRDAFLSYTLMFMGDELYSKETGTCDFSSDAFISMLRCAQLLPSETKRGDQPYLRVYSGEQMLMTEVLRARFVDFIAYDNTVLGGSAWYTGFPSINGSGPALIPQMRLGMASNSDEKEGVWEFFKSIVSEPVQSDLFNRMYLPVNKVSLEKSIDRWLTEYFREPTILEILGEDFNTVRIPGTLHEETAKKEILVLLNKTKYYPAYDDEIFEIILSTCEPLFSGAKTPEETSEIIQNKISIYLSEQYGK